MKLREQMLKDIRARDAARANALADASDDEVLTAYREALALGAGLGARRAVAHIHDPDQSRAVDRLGQLADLAAEYPGMPIINHLWKDHDELVSVGTISPERISELSGGRLEVGVGPGGAGLSHAL